MDPEYVLDRMEFYEMSALLDNLDMRDRQDWERARMVAYITAQCQCTKSIKPQDILKFPWEEEEHQEDTPEDLQEMEEMIREYELKLNNNVK